MCVGLSVVARDQCSVGDVIGGSREGEGGGSVKNSINPTRLPVHKPTNLGIFPSPVNAYQVCCVLLPKSLLETFLVLYGIVLVPSYGTLGTVPYGTVQYRTVPETE